MHLTSTYTCFTNLRLMLKKKKIKICFLNSLFTLTSVQKCKNYEKFKQERKENKNLLTEKKRKKSASRCYSLSKIKMTIKIILDILWTAY